jgi:uncharacterized iron-regulated protein
VSLDLRLRRSGLIAAALGLARALAVAGLLAACASASVVSAGTLPSSDFRVVVPTTGERITMERMIAGLTRAEVVFFGEQHDDPETHRVEAIVLDAIGRSNRPVVLSLEMFERDVQTALDDYLAGRMSETDFLAVSRPWPRYATDYRPLVELAKARGWPVIASNVPRPFASAIGRRGLAALDTLSSADRRYAAVDIACPADDYRARFMEQMRSHSPSAGPAPQAGDTLPTAVAERFYLSQCVKDETMAESIVDARRRAAPNAIVVHFNGAFHSDYTLGTADRVRRREPGWRIAVISAVPSPDPESAPTATHAGRADFIIFTRRP